MTDEIRRGPTFVEVRAVMNPIGQLAVLIQFEDGFAIVKPVDALAVAAMIVDAVDAIDTHTRQIDLADPP